MRSLAQSDRITSTNLPANFGKHFVMRGILRRTLTRHSRFLAGAKRQSTDDFHQTFCSFSSRGYAAIIQNKFTSMTLDRIISILLYLVFVRTVVGVGVCGMAIQDPRSVTWCIRTVVRLVPYTMFWSMRTYGTDHRTHVRTSLASSVPSS